MNKKKITNEEALEIMYKINERSKNMYILKRLLCMIDEFPDDIDLYKYFIKRVRILIEPYVLHLKM